MTVYVPWHVCARTDQIWRYSSIPFANLAQDGCGWSAPCPTCFTPQERDPVPNVQEDGWGLGPVWMDTENHATTSLWSPECPVCSQSLYWLWHSGCLHMHEQRKMCTKTQWQQSEMDRGGKENTRTYIHTHTHTHMHTHHAHHTHTHTNMHTHTHTHTPHTHAHTTHTTHTCTHTTHTIHTDTHAHTPRTHTPYTPHTHRHTCTHTRTHKHKQNCSLLENNMPDVLSEDIWCTQNNQRLVVIIMQDY